MFTLTHDLTAQQINNLLLSDSEALLLFDIRPSSQAGETIAGANFVEVSLLPSIFEKKQNNKLCVLIDDDGQRARQLVDLFKVNHSNVVYLAGGVQGWKKQGFSLWRVEV